MNYEILVADPAKNITVFVLSPVAEGQERAELSRALLADPVLKAEQAGFVIPPADSLMNKRSRWRLEMMGGEFCGNAARSFGLYVARKQGHKGRSTVMIEISGAREALAVDADTETCRAAAAIPKPLALETADYGGRLLPVYIFDGITQVIAAGIKPDKETFYAIKTALEKKGAGQIGAIGVMFVDGASRFMTPAVYVYGTGSLVFESSCGSGSAAYAAWESRNLRDGEGRHAVSQPGGVIEAAVTKKAGEITGITIGGPVGLGEPFWYTKP